MNKKKAGRDLVKAVLGSHIRVRFVTGGPGKRDGSHARRWLVRQKKLGSAALLPPVPVEEEKEGWLEIKVCLDLDDALRAFYSHVAPGVDKIEVL